MLPRKKGTGHLQGTHTRPSSPPLYCSIYIICHHSREAGQFSIPAKPVIASVNAFENLTLCVTGKWDWLYSDQPQPVSHLLEKEVDHNGLLWVVSIMEWWMGVHGRSTARILLIEPGHLIHTECWQLRHRNSSPTRTVTSLY